MFYILFMILATKNKAQCALRVLGGRDADIHEYPYVARIELQELITVNMIQKYKYHPGCSCTVLTPTWSLTAAHCASTPEEFAKFKSIPNFKSVIRYGSVHGTAGSKDTFSEILSYLMHPAYEHFPTGVVYNDVSLMRAEAIQIKQYCKLSAIDYTALTGLQATVAGFGMVNYTSNPHKIDFTLNLLKPLQVLDVIVVKCPKSISKFLHPNICLARKCGERSMLCKGDSGGPLLHSSGVIGVTSIGLANCFSDKLEHDLTFIAGGITPISPFIGWIQKQINEVLN